MRYVIIGNSAAGIHAAEAIRTNDPAGHVDILSDEKYPAYARCLTSYYLAGNLPEEKMYLREVDFYQKKGFDLHTGHRAVRIDTTQKAVHTEAGGRFLYDKLLIASGASPVVPDIPGVAARGVFTLRKMEDAKGIRAFVKPGGHAVVIGGGFVSLKAAYALMKSGMKVTCVISSGQILSQMLDSEAAGMIAALLAVKGLEIKYYNDLAEILFQPDSGKEAVLQGVKLVSGEELQADVVIIGKGVQPAVDFLAGSDIAVNRGIPVDVNLRTNLPDVFAAGDVAETYDLVHERTGINAIWPNAAEQGTIAGENMSGRERVYPGSIGMNSADFYGLSTIAAGAAKAGETEGYQVCRFSPSSGLYRRLVFKDDRLVGYVLVGETAKAGILTALVKEGLSLGKQKDELERGMIKQRLLW